MFAFSVFTQPLSTLAGTLSPAAGDLPLSKIVLLFSGLCTVHGASAAGFSLWQERRGLRASTTLGGSLFALGWGTAGLLGATYGVDGGNFGWLFLGYGVLTGLGLGAAYVPPLAAAVRWFPDKPGLASGLTSMGFGGGALVGTPLKMWLLNAYAQVPQCLGSAADLRSKGHLLTQDDGSRVAMLSDGSTVPVVVPSATDISKLSGTLAEALPDHVYVIGTGATGVAEALMTMGLLYGAVIVGSGYTMRMPPEDWPQLVAEAKGDTSTVAAAVAAANGSSAKEASSTVASGKSSFLSLPPTQGTVTATSAIRTPQFWQVWTMFVCISSGGMAVTSVAKGMVNEIFGSAYPAIVTASFASAYVMGLSAANLGGRVGYGSLSDKLGRKRMFTLFAATLVPVYLCVPKIAEAALVPEATVIPLVAFVASTGLAVSMFGSVYACTPPYEADLFGSRYVGAIHGRMLTASAAAGTFGPMMLAELVGRSTRSSLEQLYAAVNPAAFAEKFGVDFTQGNFWSLVESKTVTIGSLLDVCAPGTVDPTPYLYHTSMYAAGGLALVALLSNLTVRPVHSRHFVVPGTTGAVAPAVGAAAAGGAGAKVEEVVEEEDPAVEAEAASTKGSPTQQAKASASAEGQAQAAAATKQRTVTADDAAQAMATDAARARKRNRAIPGKEDGL